MNKRVKEIRKALDLTMEKFGARLGVKKNTISQIESGKNGLTDQMLRSICREFNVNEEWLRYGRGEMFIVAYDDFMKQLKNTYNLDSTVMASSSDLLLNAAIHGTI